MKRYKVGILGHFGGENQFLDGQTVKTKNITAQLKKKLGVEQVFTADTYGSVWRMPKCFYALWSMLVHCDNIIILPAQNAVRVFPAFLVLLNPFYKRKLHYVVIGGWLPQMVKHRPILRAVLKKLDYIYVETTTMEEQLLIEGIENVKILPNFKNIHILSERELTSLKGEPYRLCTFSRVMKEKGIEDAVKAVKIINNKYGRTVFTLDIFGQVNSKQVQWFKELRESFPDYVQYRGIVPFDQSVKVLMNYAALLFPTYYHGEGFAGTIVDAFSAGVPVIASDWKYNKEIITSGKVGLVYPTGDLVKLVGAIERIVKEPQKWNNMKYACLQEAFLYSPGKAIKALIDALG